MFIYFFIFISIDRSKKKIPRCEIAEGIILDKLRSPWIQVGELMNNHEYVETICAKLKLLHLRFFHGDSRKLGP